MSKLTFMVCPHDTVSEPERWYRLEQYLIQHLGIEVQFTISLDFPDFHASLEQADIVYTNPSSKLSTLVSRGFTSVARPANMYDEAVLVANTEVANPTIAALQGATIVTVKTLIPTDIALYFLKNQGITPGSLQDKDSWLSVISSVWNKEADFGIVYKDTYDGLSEQGKGMIQVFATTNEQKAFHTLDISPSLADRKSEIENLLLNMHTDEKGKEVLNELHIAQWLPVTPEELAIMERLASESA